MFQKKKKLFNCKNKNYVYMAFNKKSFQNSPPPLSTSKEYGERPYVTIDIIDHDILNIPKLTKPCDTCTRKFIFTAGWVCNFINVILIRFYKRREFFAISFLQKYFFDWLGETGLESVSPS